ncbi:MAG TPA: CidA/LrgA family protein [Woeseiaceae bacterium]|nr:CidA/LrgA family protein [Woeseiaceae bacterium]
MLGTFVLLIAFQIAGEFIRLATGAPVPGPIFGMGLLLCWLRFRGGPCPETLSDSAQAFLGYLPLLFVPAAVGVVTHLDLLHRQWPAMLGAVLGSAVLTITITARIATAVAKMKARRGALPRPRTVFREPAE